ncbi:T9SS sorting signal type C domain-containing protein [Flavobacterium nackdongense]|uniref:T9SS type A sorting domain-containing protein n=1 Tax=Flavobacterium nackdongense TaxID=2547394 RepID=A0A4P6Y9T5_9FLAO|nr:T9SS sorting signal type C domain-containing protein [Flavobacterium nackdongense]QBN17454.1 T9SS type A sorting domain-containing protein [Flavobacterium nackdongense]
MKKQLLSRKRLSELGYSLCLIVLCVNMGWGQQVIGQFPFMDGGLEGQAATTSIPSGSSTNAPNYTSWTISSTSAAATRAIYSSASTARTGQFSAGYAQTATATNLRLQVPASPAGNILGNSTDYIVQYYYKSSVDPTGAAGSTGGSALTGAIYVSGTSGSVTAATSTAFTANTWLKYAEKITTPVTPTASATANNPGNFACSRIAASAGAFTGLVYIDDFVVYQGSIVDITAPDPVTGASVSNSSSTPLVSWTAPVNGVDGGGYVVVRYAANPDTSDDINNNGIYKVGNTTTAGTIVYIGTTSSFTDSGAPAGAYYKIYTVDKAFNYNLTNEVTTTYVASGPVITASPAFSTFSYVSGSGPSTVQNTSVTGSNLSSTITLSSLPSNFELSTDNFTTVATLGSFILPTSGGTLYVRLKAGLTNGVYAETIPLVSDATTLNLSVSGSVSGSYTYNGSGSLTDAGNWSPTPNITGANATFLIQSNATTDSAWTLGAGSKIILGNASVAGATLTIAPTFPIIGTIDVAAASSGVNSLVLQSATYPTFGTLDASSEVHLQIQPIASVSSAISFGKVFIDGGSLAPITIGGTAPTFSGALTVNNKLTIAAGSILNINSTVYNAFYFTGSAICDIQGTVKQSRAINLVSFGAALSTATGAPGLQFANAENAGVNFILGSASTVEFSRGNSGTAQIITPRTDYANLTISDGTAGANAKTVSGTINVSGTLTSNQISASSAISGSPFVLANGASIVRTAGSFGNGITFGSTVNLTYNGAGVQTPGAEMPADGSVLNNLTIAGTASLSLNADKTINNDLTILGSGSLAQTAGNLTVKNNLINSSTLGAAAVVLNNNANLIQGAATTVNANSGAITVKRNSSLLSRLDYTLWSSPVSGQNLLAFSPATTTTRFYNYNTSFGTNGAFSVIDPTTNSFTSGSGYLIRMPNTAVDAPATETFNGQFSGVPNNGDVPVTLIDGLVTGLRYNLLGNPYPSPIKMQNFVFDNTANIESTLYFWRKTNGVGTAYCTWQAGATVNDPGTFVTNNNTQSVNPLDVIQTGQGFFVEAKSGASAMTFKNSQRVANTAGQFFKTKQVIAADKVWLNATNAAGDFSQMAVTYNDNAFIGVDRYDGKYINDSAFALTSKINNGEYTIQGRPTFIASDVVALSFKTATAGDYTIAIDHAEGVFATGQEVYLVDSQTATETNLKEGAYTFTAAAGVDNARFTLKFQKTLKVDAAAWNDANVMLYKNKGILYVNSTSKAINSVRVYDVQGRLIVERNNVKANTTNISNLKEKNQVLIVKVIGEDNSEITKKVLN